MPPENQDEQDLLDNMGPMIIENASLPLGHAERTVFRRPTAKEQEDALIRYRESLTTRAKTSNKIDAKRAAVESLRALAPDAPVTAELLLAALGIVD
jgi:hypothetical protein